MRLVIDEEATSDYMVSGLAIDDVLHEVGCYKKPRRAEKFRSWEPQSPVSIP
jgi:hypothetical protein